MLKKGHSYFAGFTRRCTFMDHSSR